MSDEGNQKRLSAILAADVVGYTRLMEEDTEGTVASWKSARADIIDPIISKHFGRIVKHTGDGFLAEFSTVQDSVKCAVAMQDALNNSPLDFRMGINLGDIIDDGEDIHGEGVNIAARIEALAEPGRVCVSSSVFEQVRNRLDLQFHDMGEHEMKHVSAPVHVYQITVSSSSPVADVTKGLTLPDKPSIAVLPFENLSGDMEQQYFADGIAEDITTELSRFDSIFVISRNSAFAYRDKDLKTGEISRELGVEYVLEGSVRRGGDRLRISVQLISTDNNNHAWAERYDRSIDDIFEVQDEITETVVSTLVGRIVKIDTERANAKKPDNLTAYDHLLRGLDIHKSGSVSPERGQRAFEQFSRAVELSPNFARAHAWQACSLSRTWSVPTREEDLRKSKEIIERALEIDPDEAESHRIAGALNRMLGNFEKADYHIERSLALNPNDAHVICKAAEHNCYMGRPENAEELIARSMRINPHFPEWYWEELGLAKYVARQNQAALEYFSKVTKPNINGLIYGAAASQELGDSKKSGEYITQLIDEMPSASIRFIQEGRPYNCYKNPKDLERLLTSLRLAGLPK